MKPSDGAILITGANGMIGRALGRRLALTGYEVRALVRRPEEWKGFPDADVAAFRYELPDVVDELAFDGRPAALIHCAWAFSEAGASTWRINLKGLETLQEFSEKHGLERLVLISSLSAHEAAESEYGRSKREAENRLDPSRDLVIRPGLVIGNGGLIGRIRENIDAHTLVPLMFGGRQQIQYIALGDLCHGIESALRRDILGKLDIARPESVGIRDFYRAVAASADRRCRFIRLPGGVALALLRFLERRTSIRLPITSENLLGLKHMRTFETRGDLARLGIECMNLNSALESAQRDSD